MSAKKNICHAEGCQEDIFMDKNRSSLKHLFLVTELAVLTFSVFVCLIGCGPTRKEYAINEALLIDQTRSLEDQLYRAHFQIQHLERENQRLQAKLNGENGDENSDSAQSAAYDGERSDLEFDLPVTQNRGYVSPTSQYPSGSRVVASTQQAGYPALQSAQLPNNRRAVRTTGTRGNSQSQMQNKRVRSSQQTQTGYYQ